MGCCGWAGCPLYGKVTVIPKGKKLPSAGGEDPVHALSELIHCHGLSGEGICVVDNPAVLRRLHGIALTAKLALVRQPFHINAAAMASNIA